MAGVAAWIGSRDGRRGMADLITATARPRWAAQLATWAATAIWAVAAYLVFVGVMFAVYAHQGVRGAPPWWWVAVGAAAVTAFSAAGFAVGRVLPQPVRRAAGRVRRVPGHDDVVADRVRHTSGWALLLPTNSNGNYQAVSGIFYPYLPDLPIARVMFLAGIAVAALGLLGLPAGPAGRGCGGPPRWSRWPGWRRPGPRSGWPTPPGSAPHGMVIPALHDAANDRPIAYTPVCGRAAGSRCA